MATSLDGFIADKNGGVDWLNALSEQTDSDEDYGYAKFISEVDVLVMGRNTYDQVLSFGMWPYGELPVTVITHRDLPTPLPDEAMVSTQAGTPAEILAQLAADGLNHVYLDGGELIRQFLSADLVDEIIITKVPALLGDGLPPFTQPLPLDRWETHRVQGYPNGFVQTHLLKIKESAAS